MDCKFKVEIMIDEERVLADGLYNPKDMRQIIIDIFTKCDIPLLECENERMLVFGTEEHKMYARIWNAILKIEGSIIMPYLAHYMWYNNETGGIENIIEESAEGYRSRGQGNGFRYMAEVIIDTEKVLRDNAFDLKDMQKKIIEIFKANDIPKLKSTKKKNLIFGTKERNDYGKLMRSIHKVCFSEMHPYLKKVIWYNFENDSNKDMLAAFKGKGWL